MKLRKPELSLGALKRWLTSNALTLATLLGVILGIILGFALRTSRDEPWSRREVLYVSFIGELFLRALKCVIIPLVVPSIVVAIGSLDVSLSKRIGIQCIVYYLSTTVVRTSLCRASLTEAISVVFSQAQISEPLHDDHLHSLPSVWAWSWWSASSQGSTSKRTTMGSKAETLPQQTP